MPYTTIINPLKKMPLFLKKKILNDALNVYIFNNFDEKLKKKKKGNIF